MQNRIRYNPARWYWIVGGDDSRAWSSASSGYVPASDGTYQAWLAAGGVATRVPDEGVLAEVTPVPTPASVGLERRNGGVLFQGSVFPTDGVSLAALQAHVSRWADGDVWRASTGALVPLSPAEAGELLSAAVRYVAACMKNEAALAAAGASGAALQEGWPS